MDKIGFVGKVKPVVIQSFSVGDYVRQAQNDVINRARHKIYRRDHVENQCHQ